MRFFTSTTFRTTIANLTKKSREGYMSIVDDICKAFQGMPDSIIRDTNDRVRQQLEYRLVKLRLPNSGQHLSKKDGFRLIYFVSNVTDDVVFLRVYPKRGPQGINNLQDSEYNRLLAEMCQESLAHELHQVDVNNSLAELSPAESLSD